MSVVATIPGTGGGSGSGLGDFWNNLPFVGKMGVVGAVAGLTLLLYRRSQTAGTASTSNTGGNISATDSYGLPNTAVMLGSLQEEMLNLTGSQSAGFLAQSGQLSQAEADLSGQMSTDTQNLADQATGNLEVLQSQLDQMGLANSTGLTNLQNNITASQQASMETILNAIGASTTSIQSDLAQRSDMLSTLISGNDAAMSAALNSFQQSSQQGLSQITAQQNAEAAAIGALGNNVTAAQQTVIGQLNAMQSNDLTQSNDLSQGLRSISNFLGWQFYQIPNRYAAYIPGEGPGNYGGNPTASGLFGYNTNTSPAINWSSLAGRILYSSTDNSYYAVQTNGAVMRASQPYAAANAGQAGVLNTTLSMSSLSQGSIG